MLDVVSGGLVTYGLRRLESGTVQDMSQVEVP